MLISPPSISEHALAGSGAADSGRGDATALLVDDVPAQVLLLGRVPEIIIRFFASCRHCGRF